MKELVEVIAKALVDRPEEVRVTEEEREDAIVLKLSVAEADMGRVIGKGGKIAKSIRTVLRAASARRSKHVLLDID
ncbi:KH domain-containing protein [Stomatobaculum longum]|uniref:KH domain-containing protein n=1 Tax=Stomatobaculum longum TaxID=796942 RepID=UPI0028060B42|nr:KH domain-containing protein [Stomatobaculum longum]